MIYTAFDTETTGLQDDARILEIAGIKLSPNGILGRFSALINPDMAITENATKVHGITNADIYYAEPADVVLYQFFLFCSGSVLIGHFPEYDIRRIYFEIGRILEGKSKLPLFLFFDTKRIAKDILPDSKQGYSLTNLANHYGIEISGAHRAMKDAEMVMELFGELTRGMTASDINKYMESSEQFLPTQKKHKKLWTPNT